MFPLVSAHSGSKFAFGTTSPSIHSSSDICRICNTYVDTTPCALPIVFLNYVANFALFRLLLPSLVEEVYRLRG